MGSPASGSQTQPDLNTQAHASPLGDQASAWLTADRLGQIRSILLGLTLFVALLVWLLYSLGFAARGAQVAGKLRVLGAMSWIYALVQIIDHRFWNSRFAQRRRAALGIPESLFGWLLGQMLAWFGIAYYALTGNAHWYLAGLAIFVLSFLVFPIRGQS